MEITEVQKQEILTFISEVKKYLESERTWLEHQIKKAEEVKAAMNAVATDPHYLELMEKNAPLIEMLVEHMKTKMVEWELWNPKN